MERPNGTGGSGTARDKTHQGGSVIKLEPASTPSAPVPSMPACHIRPQQWSPRTSAASKYAPFVFIKRKYTSEDEESGDEDVPHHVPAAAATTGPPEALLCKVPGAAEVGGGSGSRVAPPPLITYKRRSKMQAAATDQPQRFKSLDIILQETAPGDQ